MMKLFWFLLIGWFILFLRSVFLSFCILELADGFDGKMIALNISGSLFITVFLALLSLPMFFVLIPSVRQKTMLSVASFFLLPAVSLLIWMFDLLKNWPSHRGDFTNITTIGLIFFIFLFLLFLKFKRNCLDKAYI